MKLFEKRKFQIGGAVAAVAMLGLLTPRAAHAIAAALVQVTNTAANPVITQSVNSQAAQTIDIGCIEASPGGQAACTTVSGGGQYATPPGYTVPANQTLVITGVDITPYWTTTIAQCAGASSITVTTNGAFRKGWQFTGGSTVHYTYPTGFLLGPGCNSLGDYVSPVSACAASVEMHGYLTTN